MNMNEVRDTKEHRNSIFMQKKKFFEFIFSNFLVWSFSAI